MRILFLAFVKGFDRDCTALLKTNVHHLISKPKEVLKKFQRI